MALKTTFEKCPPNNNNNNNNNKNNKSNIDSLIRLSRIKKQKQIWKILVLAAVGFKPTPPKRLVP